MTERIALKPKRIGIYGLVAEEKDVDFFSSGSKLLDLALGGGWAERRVINIIGDTSTGKTLLCIEAAANFIRKYPQGKIRYCEAEAAFSRQYAATMGMPIDKVDFGKEPIRTIEDLYEELEVRTEKAKQPELMIVDSLDALSSRAEMDRAIDKGSYGGEKAKQLSALFRRINSAMAAKNITMMIVSQIRDRIGVVYGRKWEVSGGHALAFYSSQRVVLKQLGKLKKTVRGIERPIGIQVLAYLEKNKCGPAYREAMLPILFNFGIDDEKSCRDFLAKLKVKVNNKESLSVLHREVKREWLALEESFAPKRKKYT